MQNGRLVSDSFLKQLIMVGVNSMGQSIAIVLFGIAVLCGLYSISCSILQEIKARKLARWVKEQYPDAWKSLPWILRTIIRAEVGLRQIQQSQLVNDAVFNEGYAAVQKYNRHVWLSLLSSLVLLIIVGTL
jgi:hypothetical protein